MSDVTAIILAAGRSSRMGAVNKLTRVWSGKPLVRHVVDAVLASSVEPFVVVTGHEPETVRAVLPDGVQTIHHPNYADGMASSIRAGLEHVGDCQSVMILLGDMPLVTAGNIDDMVTAFSNSDDTRIVIATDQGQWGNPVLFGAAYLDALSKLKGDRGARALVDGNREHVETVEIGRAASRDFDTADAFDDDEAT